MRLPCLARWVLGCVLVAAPAQADPVTLRFEGALTFAGGNVGHALSTDDSFLFFLSYDTAPNPQHAPWSLHGHIGGYRLEVPAFRVPDVRVTIPGTSMFAEADLFSGQWPGDLLPGGYGLRLLSFLYSDPLLGAQLATDPNPTAQMTFTAYYTPPHADGVVVGAPLGAAGVTTSIARVPEPTTLLLALCGLAASATCLKRRT